MKTEKKSIYKNTIFYLVYQILNIAFPFLTSMYVARVLLPEKMGNVVYAQTITNYFSVLAFLGIPSYGMREVAKVRDDKKMLSKLFSELFIINLISTTIFAITYLFVVIFSNELRNQLNLYLITGFTIVLNALNVEWLYTGLEEFAYISTRNIIIKCVSFCCLLLFVKQKEDYLLYAFITVIGVAGNNIINIIYSKKIISFNFHDLSLGRHIKSVLELTAVNLAIELYSFIDITMLGQYSKTNVAIYSYGSRIYKIFLQIVNSITTVTVPRLAYLYKNDKKMEFNDLIKKTLITLFVIAFPLICGIQIVANEAIVFFYGDVFSESANVLRILVVLLIISPVGYLLGSRVLLIVDKEKWMCVAVFIAAIINIIGNYFLIPKMSYIGATFASVLSEIVLLVVYLLLSKKYYELDISSMWYESLKIIVGTISSGIAAFFVGRLDFNPLFMLVLQCGVAIVVYFSIELFLKESIVLQYYNGIMRRLRKNKMI